MDIKLPSTRFLVLAVMVAMLSTTECQRLAISPPGTQTKKLNTGTILTCHVLEDIPGGSTPSFYWLAPDGSTITAKTGRVHVEKEGPIRHRLYISRVRAEDAGLYSCECIIGEEKLRADTRLEIFEDITFRISKTEMEARVGESPLLECTATGKPQPQISWRFNRRPVIDDDIKYKYESRGLRIYNLKREDAGFYECRAEVVSQGNLKVQAINLDVKYKPIITVKPEEKIEIILGQEKELRCQGMGNPDVSYKWFKEHYGGEFAKIKVMLQEKSDTYTLKAVKKEDGGRYFCKVFNLMGSEEAFTDVTVLEAATVEDMPPIEKPLENNVLFLTCRVRGDPQPTVVWEKVGLDTVFIKGIQPNDPSITVDNSRQGVSKLIIHDIQRSYSGQYRCLASNKAGNDSKTTNVSVEFIPTINTTDTEKYGWPGEVRNFTCTGYGKPLPTLNWLCEGQYISDSETYRVFTTTDDVVTSTLQITVREKQHRIFGSYSCIAKNKYNYIRETVHLREATVPGMVGNITLDHASPTSVVLKMDLPKDNGHLPVTSWKVQYQAPKEIEVETEEKTLFFGKDDEILVSDLEAGVMYTFYLSVGNAVGYSEAAEIKIKTLEHKKQADLPIINDIDDTIFHRTGSESQFKGNAEAKEVLSKDTGDTKGKGGVVAIGVGITVSLAVIVLLIVGLAIFLRKRARKQDDYTKTWKGMFGNGRKAPLSDHEGTMVRISESKDIDQVQLEIKRIDGSQPDIIAQASPKPSHIDKCRSPFEIRKKGSTPRLESPLTPGSNPDTLQQRAWDQMLMKQALQEEEEAAQFPPQIKPADELTPMVDLPPPPDYMLESNESPARNALNQGDNVSYHDILDGYHSEENIDDGEHFEIRLPHSNKQQQQHQQQQQRPPHKC